MTFRYAWVALVILVGANGALYPWLDGPGRTGLLVAAAIAWPVQVGAFALLLRHAARPAEGMLVWIGVAVVRMAIVLGLGLAVSVLPNLSPAPTLLGCAGFFFVLLMLEPAFLAAQTRSTSERS